MIKKIIYLLLTLHCQDLFPILRITLHALEHKFEDFLFIVFLACFERKDNREMFSLDFAWHMHSERLNKDPKQTMLKNLKPPYRFYAIPSISVWPLRHFATKDFQDKQHNVVFEIFFEIGIFVT